jgi:hypothetical protein
MLKSFIFLTVIAITNPNPIGTGTDNEPIIDDSSYISVEECFEEQGYDVIEIATSNVNGPASEHLTKSAGVFNGPSGKETYYNLNMSGVVSIMRGLGYSEEEYPYWVREDGVKMLGDYVMCAAAFSIRPRGSVVETSLGTALVCDTGGFAAYNETQVDIAVSW